MKTTLEDNIYWLLLLASITAKQKFGYIAETLGLTTMQFITLCLIESERGISMNIITSTLGCDASNVTGLVERLVNNGLIERCECAEDRRTKIVTLTRKGRRIRKQGIDKLNSFAKEFFDNLTREEQEMLVRLLIKTLPANG